MTDEIVLVPLWHAPPADSNFSSGGHVHLHVLDDVKVGRRIRVSGECLCSKRHGSDERVVGQDELSMPMCPECVKVADDNGIEWHPR